MTLNLPHPDKNLPLSPSPPKKQQQIADRGLGRGLDYFRTKMAAKSAILSYLNYCRSYELKLTFKRSFIKTKYGHDILTSCVIKLVGLMHQKNLISMKQFNRSDFVNKMQILCRFEEVAHFLKSSI